MPFVFGSNGDGFLFHDRIGQDETVESVRALEYFPRLEELWQHYYDGGSRKAPLDYQVNVIQAMVEAIARSQRRILLVMATGSGKWIKAFQIIWRLWRAGRCRPGDIRPGL